MPKKKESKVVMMDSISEPAKLESNGKSKVSKKIKVTDKPILKKRVSVSKAVEKPVKGLKKKKTKYVPTNSRTLLGINEIALEIKKNKDCYPIILWDTAAVFVKKVSISCTKINENSVFQPHEKKEDKVYCVIGIFEYNRALVGGSHADAYQPYVDRGAKIWHISDISEIAYILESI